MKTVIITRYNEKIDWIEYIIDFVDQIIIFIHNLQQMIN